MIPRWYCPTAHCTFSLLPDHLAAHLPGTLADLEAVVTVAEQAPSLAAAADGVRTDAVSLPTALRWVRRRLALVRRALATVLTLLPELCPGGAPTLSTFGMQLACQPVLPCLRGHAEVHLTELPHPLGFRRQRLASGGRKQAHQQSSGPDPPSAAP